MTEGPPRYLILWTSAAAIAGGVLAFIVLGSLGLKDPFAHLFSHLAFAVPALALLVAAIRRWPPAVPERYAELARRVLVTGLAVAGGGQLMEGLGAFGYTGNGRENVLAVAHDLGLGISTLGLLALMFGIGLSILVVLSRRLGLEERWMKFLVGVVVVGLILFVGGSFIFGY